MSDSILPPNATRVELACERGIAVSRPDLTPVAALMNPDTCPVHLLPWLAWALSVDFWDSGWSEETKRASIRESVSIHRVKGTLQSVRRALKAAGYGDATVVERYGYETYDGAYKYDGSITYSEPDHWAEYRVYLTRPITIEQAAQVRAILRLVAPARCHLKGLFFTEALNSYNGRITYDGSYTYGVA
ncbi:phage tail protein I [Halocynthiibacter namhaensis]|uniref:phage tail protein I n=1 Tax=Halocynthiibacter namhaensis TaxID=1290553 RepID=UPI000578E3CF|nr:phage tail protein I [Halocynthiibacter namhaensis]